MARYPVEDEGLSFAVELEDDQISRYEYQIEQLARRGVHFSNRAQVVVLIAIDSILKEPGRDWPDLLTDQQEERKSLQDRFIDSCHASRWHSCGLRDRFF